MPTLFARSSVPGTLYLDGQPAAALGEAPSRAALSERGVHLLFAPYEEGFAPVARYIRPFDRRAVPEGVRGLSAILWPGGSLEIAIDPPSLLPPQTVEQAPFMDGFASLLRGQSVALQAGGQVYPLGRGPGCALRTVPGGLVAAFAQQEEGESLLILAPGQEGSQVALFAQGEQILLSQDGERVRVQEIAPAGSLYQVQSEYLRQGDGYAQVSASLLPTARIASTPQDIARAVTSAVLLGAQEEALAMLTPSLRQVIDAPTLTSFFGEFDGYTQARNALPTGGGELLALLCPSGEGHLARVLAFEAVMTEQGLRVDNIRAWDEGT